MFGIRATALQGELNLGLAYPELSQEEQELAHVVESAIDDSSVTSGKVVVVAISSSPLGLYAMRWGQVSVANDGLLKWGFEEDLIGVTATGPVGAVDSRKTFTTGEPPAKGIRLQSEADEDSSGVPATDDE
jgi:hypothetical protein